MQMTKRREIHSTNVRMHTLQTIVLWATCSSELSQGWNPAISAGKSKRRFRSRVRISHEYGGEMGGFLPGFPEFSSWLGKNSSRNKKDRLLQEIAHHMNYKVSADNTELRLAYLPVMRDLFTNKLLSKNDDGKRSSRIKEAIEIMDQYGLDRDDIMHICFSTWNILHCVFVGNLYM